MIGFCALFVVLSVDFISCNKTNNDNLICVIMVHRHGARTPTNFVPNDIYKDPKYWEVAPGELTQKGEQQQHSLGQWLRNRYNGFLPDIYNTSDIYVQATEIQRCQMSAAANLAGLYPPSTPGPEIGCSTLQWMLVPIHAQEEAIIKTGRACPNFKAKYEVVLNSNFTSINKNNAELYEYLSKHIGAEIKRFDQIERVYDTLFIENENGMKLPEWINKILSNGLKVFPDELKKWADFTYTTQTYTKELARLSTGRFFDMLASNFIAASKHDTNNMLSDKMIMFSGHKSTIGDVTSTLGVFRLVPYAGALMFELRRNPKTKRNYINVIVKSGDTLESLKIEGCDLDCDFNEFLKIVEPYRLTKDQWNSECLRSRSAKEANTPPVIYVYTREYA